MKILDYNIIQPPFTLKYWDMSKAELKGYFQWFLSAIPSRIVELTKAVRQYPGFEGWRPDYTPKSLETLGRWLATQVETRPRTKDELGEIAARLPHPEYVSKRVPTNRTISLAYDVGMYLAEVLMRNHPSLKWDQIFGSKRFIYYGQPVLMGFHHKIPFNPVGVMHTQVHGLIDKQFTGNRLREVYDALSGEVAS